MQSSLEEFPARVKDSDSASVVSKESCMSSSVAKDSDCPKNEHSISPQPPKRIRKRSKDVTEVDVDCGNGSTVNEPNNQLVLYNNETDGTSQQLLPLSNENRHPLSSSRVLPSVGAFTIQCSNCFKWRLIPTKQKYEEIREHILEIPFMCDQARAWRPDISCDDEADIYQDGSRLWAIDKPNIARPPPGWERQLRIRAEGGIKFADVYYVSPSGKKLRSMVEVQKYLSEHPEYTEQGVTKTQFSFQTPRPLQENYVRKRQRVLDGPDMELPRPLEPDEVNPISWIEPSTDEDFHIAVRGPNQSPPSYDDAPLQAHQQASSPAKKKMSKTKIYLRNCSNSADAPSFEI